MLRTGRVVNAGNGEIEVCFDRPEACEHCNACAGQKHHTLVKVPGEAPVGSLIDVEMPPAQLLKASALAYAAPLALMILGVVAGLYIFHSETAGAVTGVAMMAVSYGLLRLFEKKSKGDNAWQPSIAAVHEEQEEGE